MSFVWKLRKYFILYFFDESWGFLKIDRWRHQSHQECFISVWVWKNEWVLFWVKENSIFIFWSDFELRFWFLWKNKLFQKIIKIIIKLLLWWCLRWWMSCWSSLLIISHINWWLTLVFLVEYQGVDFQSQLSGVEHDFSNLFTFFENQFFVYLSNKTEIFNKTQKVKCYSKWVL